MPDLISFGRSFLAFAVVLGVLVTVHELGHYLAARWRGVGVEAFSIGFGRAIAQWTDRRGTVWKLGWIPLGGYVKMHGQERPTDVAEDVRASWDHSRTYQDKSVLSRMAVIAAGPVANFLLAIVLFTAMFVAIGRPIQTSVIGRVVAGSAAERGGIVTGDRIVAIGAEPTKDFADIQRIVTAHPGQTLPVTVERAGSRLTLPVTTEDVVSGTSHVGKLGVGSGAPDYVSVGPLEALTGGVAQTWDVAGQTLAGFSEILSGHRGSAEIGGPLRIAELSGQVVQLGIGNLIMFIGLLSVNLGLINLFPIPVLDGGHLVFLAAEGLRGKPIPQRAQEYGFGAGLALLACLFVFATWNDLGHLGLFRLLTGGS